MKQNAAVSTNLKASNSNKSITRSLFFDLINYNNSPCNSNEDFNTLMKGTTFVPQLTGGLQIGAKKEDVRKSNGLQAAESDGLASNNGNNTVNSGSRSDLIVNHSENKHDGSSRLWVSSHQGSQYLDLGQLKSKDTQIADIEGQKKRQSSAQRVDKPNSRTTDQQGFIYQNDTLDLQNPAIRYWKERVETDQSYTHKKHAVNSHISHNNQDFNICRRKSPISNLKDSIQLAKNRTTELICSDAHTILKIAQSYNQILQQQNNSAYCSSKTSQHNTAPKFQNIKQDSHPRQSVEHAHQHKAIRNTQKDENMMLYESYPIHRPLAGNVSNKSVICNSTNKILIPDFDIQTLQYNHVQSIKSIYNSPIKTTSHMSRETPSGQKSKPTKSAIKKSANKVRKRVTFAEHYNQRFEVSKWVKHCNESDLNLYAYSNECTYINGAYKTVKAGSFKSEKYKMSPVPSRVIGNEYRYKANNHYSKNVTNQNDNSDFRPGEWEPRVKIQDPMIYVRYINYE